jgi:hypothetical protein
MGAEAFEMLTFWGDKNRFCDNISRRDFLRVGAFGQTLNDFTGRPRQLLDDGEPISELVG